MPTRLREIPRSKLRAAVVAIGRPQALNPRRSSRPVPLLAALVLLLLPWALGADQVEPSREGVAGQVGPVPVIDGPPPPTPPEVMNRDAEGRVTVRALQLEEPIRLDGLLDESLYLENPPITGFVQSLPDEGEPATEKTEVWITYDDENVYFAARLHDSAPESEWVANEMRRDTNQLRQNDTFGIVLDTFYDRRNGMMFYTNPLGARADFAITNEGSPNFDWNPVWDVRTGRFDGGWTVEMAVPFSSLRYRPGTSQTWGLQLRRVVRRKNEWAHLTLIPRSASGGGAAGSARLSLAATLVGLAAPPGGLDLEAKPYGIAGLSTDRSVSPRINNDGSADAGLDIKYGITQNLTADLTFNTDFAQVEVDERQVNLTRFSLFFPEKREFFLEGRGIFAFPSAPIGVGGGRGFGGGGRVPTLFFSRRIGLQGGEPVPIRGGGRVTGKVGPFDVGAINVQTNDLESVGAEATNFSVMRLRRDILRRSSVGALYARRSHSLEADRVNAEGANETYGVDATFSFFQNVNFGGYYARTRTPGLDSRDASYQARASFDGDEWGAGMEHLLVGQDFNPEVGFLRRDGFRLSHLTGRFSPRPASIEWVRQFTFQGTFDYYENDATHLVETREAGGRFRIELENSDSFSADFTDSYENLVDPFPIASGVTIPVGRYRFRDVQLGYSFSLQRPYSGNLSVRRGTFFSGNRTSVGFRRARIEILPQLSVEPGISLNWVNLPQGDFTQHVASTRVSYSFSPWFFLSGLIQYSSNSDTFSTNLRLRYEYAPGSELFVVYTEERDTDVFDRFSRLSNRGLVIKVNRLLRL